MNPKLPPEQRAAILAAVVKYARERWCWDDESLLEEMVDTRYDTTYDTPTEFVDELARHYDLEDPGERGCW